MSNNVNRKKILLIGAGFMAREYIKVVRDLEVNLEVVGNSKENAEKLQNECGIEVKYGGIQKYLESLKIDDDVYAIVAVNERALGKVTKLLVQAGCKHILVEKPGVIDVNEGKEILCLSQNCSIYVAYNRRFYASTYAAEEIINQDGGVSSFNIEFTEWKHIFDQMENKDCFDKMVLANSSHVIDMAMFLSGGKIDSVSPVISGKDIIEWHRSGSVFGGVGFTDKKQIFTYSANWNAPGRWGIELNTSEHRLIFRPLEKLQLQDRGSVKIYEVDTDYSLDEKYKPGLYREVIAFLNDDMDNRLCTLKEQVANMDFYSKISGENYYE